MKIKMPEPVTDNQAVAFRLKLGTYDKVFFQDR